ncbi:MAG: GDP-mannose 4,6-dehydratase, partial [Candidatus Nanoarchaeia archaeon]
AQSFFGISFEDAFTTIQTNIMGTLHILEALKQRVPKCKLYFAGSSEMFGKAVESPQNENTPFHPRSPYGVSKVTGFDLVRNYREAYGMFACNGMLFNHESPRRGYEFVTRKITRAVADIKHGRSNVLVLGNLEARRDWGFAGEYVEAMWKMLQQDKPEDFVIGTGDTHTIKEFVDAAFSHAGLTYELVDLSNLSVEEADRKVAELEHQKDKVFVVQHARWFRPAEVDLLHADLTKAKNVLGWEPKVKFNELVKMMVDRDLE